MNNKIVITGYSISYLELAKNILVKSGVKPALPSKRENLTAQEVTNVLLKAYQVTPLKQWKTNEDNKCVTVDRIWEGIVLDLLLANLDQDIWCWEDENILPLANYWKGFDAKFILLYEHPRTLFEKFTLQSTEEEIQTTFDNWIVYHNELLDFYLKNSDRCILLSSEALSQNPQLYLRCLEQNVNLEFNELNTLEAAQVQMIGNGLVENTLQAENVSKIIPYFMNRILAQRADVLKLYNDLNELANLPLNVVPSDILNSDYDYLKEIIQILQRNENLYANVNEVEQKLKQVSVEKNQLNKSFTAITKDFENSKKDNSKLKHDLAHLAEEIEEYVLLVENTKQKNSRLNADLLDKNRVVSVLEENLKKLTQTADWRFGKIKQLNDTVFVAKSQAEKLSTQILQLKKDLKAEESKVKTNPKESETITFLKNKQKQLEDELDYYYNKVKNQQKSTVKQPEKKVGAANLVKKDLPYQFGQELLSVGKDLKKLPRFIKKIQSSQKDIEKYQPASMANYQDSLEAEKMKQHLSYRLGDVLVDVVKQKNSKFKWVKLPLELSKEIVLFKISKTVAK